MIIYKCAKCGSFLASFKSKNQFTIKAKKGITIQDNKIILKCRCGHKTEVDKRLLEEEKKER